MSIKDIAQKIKWSEVFVVLAIILLSTASFGIYKLWAFENNRGLVQVLPSDVPISEIISEKTLVASKTGKKYHLPTCPGAKQIAEKNEIWFSSAVEAQKLGYTPATNCSGLK